MKRKAENGEEQIADAQNQNQQQQLKEKKKKKKKKKLKNEAEENKQIPTVSIAVAGSIIDNAQSLELATRLAGQIARAATIFRVDEVIVFDNKGTSADDSGVTEAEDTDANESGAPFLIRLLQYLETPQYLRRSLFPKHSSLIFVGILPPLDAPHHLRKHEWAPYREDCLRKVVPSSKPREELGQYWGYKVRYASNVSHVFNGCPYEGGYDHTIGTSEHGCIVNSSELVIPTFRHLLIAFGGLSGLEENIEEDSNLKGKDVRKVFDSYLNTCPHQGSRTIRTEEAIFISLQYFQEPIERAKQRFKETLQTRGDELPH